MARVHGLHHVTCIAGDPAENLAFYNHVLGMRLVKRTVNQDAPDTYHLFYADAAGSPGTDLTFFPWPHLPPGKNGAGLAVEVALARARGLARVLVGSPARAWRRQRRDRRALRRARAAARATCTASSSRWSRWTSREFVPWTASPVPEDRQIRGLHSVRQVVRSASPPRASCWST